MTVLLRHRRSLEAPASQVWDCFMDLHRVGQCFPGAKVTNPDHNGFEGTIAVVLGPLTMTYDGRGKLTTEDHQARHAVIAASGHERRGMGQAKILVDLKVEPGPADNSCTVTMTTDLDVRGAPTHFGSGLAQRISDPMIARFLDCMACPECPPESELVTSIDIIRTVLPDLMKSLAGSTWRRFRGAPSR